MRAFWFVSQRVYYPEDTGNPYGEYNIGQILDILYDIKTMSNKPRLQDRVNELTRTIIQSNK